MGIVPNILLAFPNLIQVSDWGQFMWTQYHVWSGPLQFIIVFLVVSWFYFKIHGTYVSQLLKGVAVILLLYLITSYAQLNIISAILQAILQISIIGFIIIFQPELRRLLVYLGQPDFLSRSTGISGGKEKHAEYAVHELVESIRLLSKTKTGALIVLESNAGIGGTYLEAGTRLDAKLSTELLLTIFHPNTPLHDGAIIISPDNRIVAAGVLLPLSENPNLSWKYGTRHRAAIGLSEISDSRCLVVSEETGSISMVAGGAIEKIGSTEELKRQLEYIYGIHSTDEKGQKRLPLAEILNTDLLQKFFTKTGASSGKTGNPPGKPMPQEERSRIGSQGNNN